MKGKKDNKNEESKKYLYAEPKFMIPPDPLKLPEPFSKGTKKEEQVKKNWSCRNIIIFILNILGYFKETIDRIWAKKLKVWWIINPIISE